MYRFRIAGEYFDAGGEANMVSGGSFTTLSAARRALRWLHEYLKAPGPGKLPAELEEVAAVAEPATLEVALYYRLKGDVEEWVMSFDPESGVPVEVTPNAETVWQFMKELMRR